MKDRGMVFKVIKSSITANPTLTRETRNEEELHECQNIFTSHKEGKEKNFALDLNNFPFSIVGMTDDRF